MSRSYDIFFSCAATIPCPAGKMKADARPAVDLKLVGVTNTIQRRRATRPKRADAVSSTNAIFPVSRLAES